MKKLNNSFDKKEKIISEYNKTSHFYDYRYGEIQREKYELILPYFDLHNNIILDAGCGTGLIVEYFMELLRMKDNINYNYVGVDISWNMLKIFQLKLKTMNLRKNYNLILSDIENLPFRKDIFDLIFSYTSLQNLPNIENGIKCLCNVGKNYAKISLSILRKTIEIDNILKLLKQWIKITKKIDEEKVEDIIISGEIFKN